MRDCVIEEGIENCAKGMSTAMNVNRETGAKFRHMHKICEAAPPSKRLGLKPVQAVISTKSHHVVEQ